MKNKLQTYFIFAILPFLTLSALEEDIRYQHCGCDHQDSNNHHSSKSSVFGYFYTTEEPVILQGEKIPLNHKTLHTQNISLNQLKNEIVFEETGSYLLTINVSAKRITVQTGTHVPVTTVSGGFLIGLFVYDMDLGLTHEIPGTRYGVLTNFQAGVEEIETQQLFAQVIVKIKSIGSRISLRSLTPAIADANSTTAMQLQARVSNPDYLTEPNVSAAITVQRL